jgi:hypothetical protein
LQPKLEAKFDEICNLVARHLGYGDFSRVVSEAERRTVIEEAQELTENWDEATFDGWDLAPKTELQRLLAEHQETGKQILDPARRGP